MTFIISHPLTKWDVLCVSKLIYFLIYMTYVSMLSYILYVSYISDQNLQELHSYFNPKHDLFTNHVIFTRLMTVLKAYSSIIATVKARHFFSSFVCSHWSNQVWERCDGAHHDIDIRVFFSVCFPRYLPFLPWTRVLEFAHLMQALWMLTQCFG